MRELARIVNAASRRAESATPAKPVHARRADGTLREERGAALIIAVAIFVVLLFIALTFYSAARMDLRTATNFENNYRTELINQAGFALAVSKLREDKRQHPTATSLDHGWTSYFNGAFLAGKPWAFPPNGGATVLDSTWVDWSAPNSPIKRVPALDFWTDLKPMEADLAGRIYSGVNGLNLVTIGQASSYAAIKNILYVPRFQLTPTLENLLEDDYVGPADFPVQYTYRYFDNFSLAFNDPRNFLPEDYDPDQPGWPASNVSPQQKINAWADVDSDGDGLRDAIWIPIALESFYGGIDRDFDGRVGGGTGRNASNQSLGGSDEGGDGIDNDLDGYDGTTNGVDDDFDGVVDEADEAFMNIDEQDEVAQFVYWGGQDGRDNDGDGDVDEIDEARVFLTAPIVADSYWGGNDGLDNDNDNAILSTDGLDNDGDGTTDEADEGIDELDEQRIFKTSSDFLDNDGDGDIDFDDPGETIPLLDDGLVVRIRQQTLNEYLDIADTTITPAAQLTITQPSRPDDANFTNNDIDRIDNDFTLITNDVHGHVFRGPLTTEQEAMNRAAGYGEINSDEYGLHPLAPQTGGQITVVTASGEAVCEITGRVAIHIVDEASKVNLNSSGALAVATRQDPSTGTVLPDTLTYAGTHGIGPDEYDTRVLPQIGVNTRANMAVLRNGEHDAGRPINFPVGDLAPGDNVSNDGDINVDEDDEAGFAYDAFLPGYGRADDNANVLQLAFDGVDNDGDGAYYLHDGIDNDGDGLQDANDPDEARFGIDELWEGIDEPLELQMYRPLRNRLAELDNEDNDEDGAVDEIGELGDTLYLTGDSADLASQVGVGTFGPLRPVLTVHSSDPNFRYQRYQRDLFGLIARDVPPDSPALTGMKLDYNYTLHDAIVAALKEDWNYPDTSDLLWTEANGGGSPYLDYFQTYTDPLATIEAVTDYAAGLRREDTTVVWDLAGPMGLVDQRDPYTRRYFEADAELRATQLALNIQAARDRDDGRDIAQVDVLDDWWFNNVDPVNKRITYTLAGVETIRINEIMVRPVRRVEVEAQGTVYRNYNDSTIAIATTGSVYGVAEYNPDLDPNLFTYIRPGVAGFPDNVPWDFYVESETVNERDPNVLDIDPVTPPNLLWAEPVTNGQTLGPRNALTTNMPFLDTALGGDCPNVIQFKFGPSAQLPPGRYYLIVNTLNDKGHATVDSSDDLQFAIKYATTQVGETDILQDVIEGTDNPATLVPPSELFTINPQPVVDLGGTIPSGQVFLPATAIAPDLTTLTNYDAARYAGYGQNEAYTVTIPPFSANAAEQVYLYVGIRMSDAATPPNVLDTPATEGTQHPIAINFFDFSQEPDHEWVEIVNISDSTTPIVLDNWKLEVGGDANGGGRRTFAVPAGTQIAPGGSLLLAFNKYDYDFEDTRNVFNPAPTLVEPATFSNGIAMVRGPVDGAAFDYGFISEPPIPRYAYPFEAGWTTVDPWGAPVGGGYSLFRRLTGELDVVDNNGDGIADVSVTPIPDDVYESTLGEVPPYLIPTGPAKPWDRIVQLRPDYFEANAGAPTLQQISSLVLGGGVLPNDPDRDGVDNDADGNILLFDGIDNDGDIVELLGLFDEPLEGVDEGGYRRYAHMDGVDNDVFGGGDLVDNDLDGEVDEIGEGIDDPAERFVQPGGFSPNPIVLAGLPIATTEYMVGLDLVSPFPDLEWKEFVERRFYPGESVVVSLLNNFNQVVDQTTYTQRDVENRSIDDVLPAPDLNPALFPDTGYDSELLGVTAAIDYDRALWPDNVMGVDFYRSLERKHPLLNGDRFGTTNRWLATDGNYDDWAPGTNRWFRGGNAAVLTDIYSLESELEVAAEYDGSGPYTAVNGLQTFTHGFSGSPLRQNYYARMFESPILQTVRSVGAPTDTIVTLASNPRVGPNYNLFPRAKVRNAHFRSQGDLLTVPHMTLTKFISPSLPLSDFRGGESLQSQQILPETTVADVGIKGPMLGMDYPKDLRALLDTATMDSISLNVGQAEFHPIYPEVLAVSGGGQGELVRWIPPTGVNLNQNPFALRTPPRMWCPVFLMSMDPNTSEPDTDPTDPGVITDQDHAQTPIYPHLPPTYPFQLTFLYNTADYVLPPPYTNGAPTWLVRDALSPAASRWPLERRAMMYVSMNPEEFDPSLNYDTGPISAATHPSEALFVWDGADGLPNGEYDVYVVTMDNMQPFATSPRWLPRQLAQSARQLPMDVRFFTDKDGDRRCWNDTIGALDNVAERSEIVQANPLNMQDAFPIKTGMVPSSDGVIHYGTVKVENNYLAMFVRNRANSGTLNVNAVSRVVLMSRDRTPGRLNLNTVITQAIPNSGGNTERDYDAFNPLTGLAAMLGDFNANGDGLFDPSPYPVGDSISSSPNGAGPLYPTGVGSDPYDRALLRATVGLVQNRGARFIDVNDDGFPEGELRIRADGRYFSSPAELVVRGDTSIYEARPLELLPPLLAAPASPEPTPDEIALQFDEMKERFARMANSVSTVSDTFEITVTAQSGFIFDANRDGVLNWRDDAEFKVTGENKTRTVYER